MLSPTGELPANDKSNLFRLSGYDVFARDTTDVEMGIPFGGTE